MDSRQWSAFWAWAKANGIAAFLGAAAVKLWDWGLRRWKHRLSPMEKLVLVLAIENGGSLKWEESDGYVALGYRIAYFKQEGKFIEPTSQEEEISEMGEIGSLISKGFVEISDSGRYRRLTPDGFVRARTLRATLKRRSQLVLTRLPGEHLEELRRHLQLAPWWKPWKYRLPIVTVTTK